jgi:hypothetical protein
MLKKLYRSVRPNSSRLDQQQSLSEQSVEANRGTADMDPTRHHLPVVVSGTTFEHIGPMTLRRLYTSSPPMSQHRGTIQRSLSASTSISLKTVTNTPISRSACSSPMLEQARMLLTRQRWRGLHKRSRDGLDRRATPNKASSTNNYLVGLGIEDMYMHDNDSGRGIDVVTPVSKYAVHFHLLNMLADP